ncbi:MAG: 50S ribosomal protein L11 methyltransferase [Prevotella sp.]|nr:50S ribosomal protein L11 methyltransferase [Prevotella sp.]
MKYFEVEFTILPFSTDAADLLAAIAGEAGFETFEETSTGLMGYIQQDQLDVSTLQTSLNDFPFEGISISYDIRPAEDRDWNEQWEQEGFEPIVVKCGMWNVEGGMRNVEGGMRNVEGGVWSEECPVIVIHDGRHLPEAMPTGAIPIEIDAKLAFGTGTHETTRMICSELISFHIPHSTFHKIRVLDCGTGTGILSICALKLGAAEAIGYDIDEWSVDNARHNAVINQVDDRFTSLLGDASILNKVEGNFDLVLANINRNILLADMESFRGKMAPGASLILSGFYTEDCEMLIEKAKTLGLKLTKQKEDQNWACLVFSL